MAKYSELLVYKRAYGLVIRLYEFSKSMPKDELFGLTSQIKRAAFGIPINIAEGYGKDDSVNELLRFLRIAKGSASELEVLLNICHDVGYMNNEQYHELYAENEELQKMLYGLIKSLKQK